MSARAKEINAQEGVIEKLRADLAAAREALTTAESDLVTAQREVKRLTEQPTKDKAFWEA